MMEALKNHSYGRFLLYALILTLVFEGVVRKAFPFLSTPLFFLKDILCFLAGHFIYKSFRNNLAKRFVTLWFWMALLLGPIVVATAFRDPVIAFFGLKQYVLYFGVCILVPLSFENDAEALQRFLFCIVLLVFPTTLMAVAQNSLGSGHWLNTSVGGESLEGFSAAGYLRVSSTFSFTAQYSWFINVTCSIIASLLFWPFERLKKWHLITILIATLPLAIGAFITGGRTAVLGCAASLFVGLLLSLFKGFGFFFKKAAVPAISLVLALAILSVTKPEFFAAYNERSAGSREVSHQQEIEGRFFHQFTNWSTWTWKQETVEIFFGNGLGVMSNGSEKISSYSKKIRESGFWTENDIENTVWEGGLYMLIVWYSIRVAVILTCLSLWWKSRSMSKSVFIAFLLGFVTIYGLVGPIGIQPPLAIWWWLVTGIIITSYRSDCNRSPGHAKDE